MINGLNKIKEFVEKFKDLTSMGSATVTSSAISAIFWFYMASVLGTEHYGEISYFISISTLASVISLIGFGNTLLVYPAKDVKIQPPVYFIALISSLITASILFFIFYNIGISLYVIGYAIFALIGGDLLGRKFYKNYSKVLIIQKILMVLLATGLYYLVGYQGVILGIALSFLPFGILMYKVFRKTKIDFSLVKSRFGFIVNSYALDISRIFSGSIDRLIVAPLFGYSLLGNYQLGLQLFSALSILPIVVYQYILPHDASGNPNKQLKRLTIIISVIFAVLSITLSPFVIPALFPKFTQAVSVIQIVSVAIIPYTIIQIYVSQFLGNTNSRVVLTASIVYLIVQITTIIPLGKIIGIGGIAMSFVLAQTAELVYLLIMDRFMQKKH
jgi:O-antigen/teichoic acid export membrane protein